MSVCYDIDKGVNLLYIPNNRFHTGLVSVNFFVPLSKETVSTYALLASLLSTCSAEYKDFRMLNLKLSELYGADISSSVTKVGDNLCLKFCVSTINDIHAFDGDSPMLEAVELLLKLLFEPKCTNGYFEDDDIKREKRMLIEHINGEINNKRIFARRRLIEEMFEDDEYAVYRYGRVKDIEKLNGYDLYNGWKKLLETAYVKIHVISEQMPENLTDKIKNHFAKINRTNITDITKSKEIKVRDNPKFVTERMQVTQGKLVVGFNCRGGNGEDAATIVMSDIFGGGPYSRLFMNVREKLSLCYYCSCQAIRKKGVLIVDSGVEAENAEKALTEIQNQLAVMQNGDFDDNAFKSSVISIKDSLTSTYDSLGRIDSWYTSRAFNDKIISPLELIEMVSNVTREEIIRAAQEVKLNTVYKLLPQEEA